MDVVHKLIIRHLHVANSHCQTQHLWGEDGHRLAARRGEHGRLDTHTRQTAHALAPGQDDGAHLKHQSNANPGSYVEEEGKLQDPPPVTMAEPSPPARPPHLLHLELNRGFDFIDFGHHVLVVGQQGRELASLIQARAQDSWDLLDQRL